MRRLMLVAAREYVSAVRTKAFVISLVIMPIFMGGSIVAMKLLEKQVDVTDRRIAIIDHTGMVAPLLEQAATHRNTNEVFDAKDHRKEAPSPICCNVSPRVTGRASSSGWSSRTGCAGRAARLRGDRAEGAGPRRSRRRPAWSTTPCKTRPSTMPACGRCRR